MDINCIARLKFKVSVWFENVKLNVCLDNTTDSGVPSPRSMMILRVIDWQDQHSSDIDSVTYLVVIHGGLSMERLYISFVSQLL